jgi:predicted deacylase
MSQQTGNFCTRLDPSKLRKGQQTRLRVELIQNGIGQPVAVPVVVARGTRPGPVFGITAAIHGNEINGIPVIHRLLRSLDLRQLRGTIVCVIVVNVPGFLNHERYFVDGSDLNHIMPGKPDGNVAEVYAYRLQERIVHCFDYLVDLHTASFGRANSLYVRADMTHEVSAKMAYLQRPQIILHNPASDYTLRGAAMQLGIPAITVEIRDPQRFQIESIRRSLVGLRSLLSEVGMLPKRPVSLGPEPVLCEHSTWLYTQHGGLLDVLPNVMDYVKKGEIIARITNIYGDRTAEYRCPGPGIVIGKSVNPVARTGARILHLGIVWQGKTAMFHRRRSLKA